MRLRRRAFLMSAFANEQRRTRKYEFGLVNSFEKTLQNSRPN
jgi:hypothetical protein